MLTNTDCGSVLLNGNENRIDGRYCTSADGKKCTDHPLFSREDRKSLRLQLFYDDMGTTNCLRGHATLYNLALFYFSIENMSAKLNSSYANVHLLAMCLTEDIKRYGFSSILNPIMDDIVLMATKGLEIEVRGLGQVQVYAGLSTFCADALAMNNIFGLVESFSHDFYCLICYVTRASALVYFMENQFKLRNKSEYEKDLRDILNNPKLTHVRGVKGIIFLNRSTFWHWTGNYCLDIMHIFYVGVILEVLAPELLLLPDSLRHSRGSGTGVAAFARLPATFWRFWCGRCCSRLTHSVIQEVWCWSCSCPTHSVIQEVLVQELLLPDSQSHSGGSGAGAALALLTESFWRF